MKTKLLIAILFIANTINAQTVTFESLIVPDTGYFNGSTEYSGSGDQETITFEDNGASFYVNYTDTGAYDYWSAFAYTNQTDLTTASYTNYSAYSTGGGANDSSNYVIAYLYGAGENIIFNSQKTITSIDLANGVWAYHYMNGSDGSGTGTYEADDFFKVTITAILNDDTLGDSVDFYLADYTDGNSYILDNWSTVDLSSLGVVKGLNIQLSVLDNLTPTYVCIDDIVYSPTASANDTNFEDNISVYPNPTTNFVTISTIDNSKITIFDTNGKVVLSKNEYSKNEKINLTSVDNGVYFIKIERNHQIAFKKLIIK